MNQDALGSESFASYLGKVLSNQRGFSAPLPDDFAALGTSCDQILARTDGHILQISCIVDRDARPGAWFAMPPADVLALGATWVEAQRFAGRKRAFVIIVIYEVGAGAVNDEAVERLSRYRTDRLFRRSILQAVLVDPERRLTWDNARRFLGRPLAFRWLRRLLAKPRQSEDQLASAIVAHDVHRFPMLTAAILAVLVAIFAMEVLYPIRPWTGLLKADIFTLLGFGGVDRALVLNQGEWWRLATAPFLHADALHIAFNGWALWLIGRLSERLMGPAWFAAVFTVSAFSGSAMSIALNPAKLLSVGASGAIVGLFVASFTLSFHLPAGATRSRLQWGTVGTIVPALIPFLSSPSGDVIDYGAHAGGAAGGLAMGVLMLLIWPKALVRPRFAPAALAVAVVGMILAVVAVIPAVAGYQALTLAQDLFEPFPKSDQEARERSEAMIAAKPHDPRARFAHALALLAAHDLSGAETDLRTGLAERKLLALIDPPHYEDRMRVVLGATLIDEKRPDEARDVVRPACSAETTGPLYDWLRKQRLCA